MKKSALILMVFMAAAMSAYSQKAKNSDTLVVRTKIYCDHCTQCGSCAGNINTSLKALYGINKIQIIAEKDQFVVVYNPSKTTPDQIRKSISSAGYDADNILAKPEAVAKLDGCCKKH